MLNRLKMILIKRTKRETLSYKIIDSLLFEILSFINYLRKGHLIRECYIRKYLKENKVCKLHLGCGNNYYKGFLNSDALSGKIYIDIRKKLPFRSNTFDEIYSNHLIEHIYKKDFISFVKECKRVLKPEGKIIFCTPDMIKIMKIFLIEKNKYKIDIISHGHKEFSFDKNFFVSNYINDLSHIFFGHKYLYSFEYLSYIINREGFIKIKQKNNYNTSDNYVNKKLKEEKNKFWDLTSSTIEAEKPK